MGVADVGGETEGTLELRWPSGGREGAEEGGEDAPEGCRGCQRVKRGAA